MVRGAFYPLAPSVCSYDGAVRPGAWFFLLYWLSSFLHEYLLLHDNDRIRNHGTVRHCLARKRANASEFLVDVGAPRTPGRSSTALLQNTEPHTGAGLCPAPVENVPVSFLHLHFREQVFSFRLVFSFAFCYLSRHIFIVLFWLKRSVAMSRLTLLFPSSPTPLF